MASWIGGSPSQRLYQYLLPAARREVNESEAVIALFKDEICKAFAKRHHREPGAIYVRKSRARYVKSLIRDLRSYKESVQRSKDLIAKFGKK